MLLDIDAIIKRVAIIAGAIVIASAIAIVTWYNFNLNTKFDQGKHETVQLRDETGTIKNTLDTTTQDIRSSIKTNADKLQDQLTKQTALTTQLEADINKLRVESRADIQKLREANILLLEQLKALSQENEKFRADTRTSISSLHEQNKSNLKEISELRIQLHREQEWRNKTFWTR